MFGAFEKENDQLAAYFLVRVNPNHIDLVTSKAVPISEKKEVNRALMFYICDYFNEEIAQGKYFCGGSKNIYHETNVHEFREKNFGFRKAYAHLHIQYAPFVIPLIKLLYPFRKIIKKLPFTLANQIHGILLMEGMRRKQWKVKSE